MLKFRLVLMAMLFAITAFCQNRTVTGKVTDDKGDPLPFATIRVKGTKTAVSADENGVFRITVPENAVLQISFSGATTKELSVGTQNDIAVSLTRTNTDLTAVTVVTTSLGIKRQSKELG